MAFGNLAEAVVDIGCNLNPLSAGLARAKGMIGSAVGGFGGLLSGPLAALGIAAGVGATLAVAVKGAAEAEAAEMGLASALKATGQDVEANMGRMKALADAVQNVTNVEGDSLMPVMQLGVNLGLNADQAQEATKAAVGLSKAYGVDMQTAMQAVSKEMQGVKSNLDRQIPALNGVEDANERLAIISKSGASGMQQQFDAADTTAGGFESLKNTVGDLLESFGGFINGGLQPVLQWLNNLIQVTTEYNSTSTSVFSGVGSAISGMGSVASTVFGWIKSAVENTIFVFSNLSNYGTILGGSLVAGFGLIADSASWAFGNVVNVATWLWENVGTLFMDGVNYSLTVLSNLGENVKRLFTGIWDFISSGGTKGFEEGFVGISEGFIAQTKALPEYQKFVEGSLTQAGKGVANQGWAALEANSKAWDAAKQKIEDDKIKNKDELTNTNLTLTDAGKKRQDEKEKKDKNKDKSSGSSFVTSIADVWKQTQEAALKKQEDGSKKLLEENKKQTKVQEEQLAWLKENFALNV
jgi:phage-related protein